MFNIILIIFIVILLLIVGGLSIYYYRHFHTKTKEHAIISLKELKDYTNNIRSLTTECQRKINKQIFENSYEKNVSKLIYNWILFNQCGVLQLQYCESVEYTEGCYFSITVVGRRITLGEYQVARIDSSQEYIDIIDGQLPSDICILSDHDVKNCFLNFNVLCSTDSEKKNIYNYLLKLYNKNLKA